MSLPRGAVGKSVVFDCCNFWSFSLVCCCWLFFVVVVCLFVFCLFFVVVFFFFFWGGGVYLCCCISLTRAIFLTLLNLHAAMLQVTTHMITS